MTKKIVLITGASRGLGCSMAETMLAAGFFVIGTATTQTGAEKIQNLLAEQGRGVVLNQANPDSCQALFEQLKSNDLLPDILINNAGITRDNLLLRMNDEQWQEVIDTNLSGVYHLTKLFLKPLMKKRWGRIINIGSVSGVLGNAGQANYAAAKAGLIGFSKSLALEVASRGITVNVVAPGFIATDMVEQMPESEKEQIANLVPMGRMAQPEEISSVVSFLASKNASYITGEVIKISGGL